MKRSIAPLVIVLSLFTLTGCEALDFLLELFAPIDMAADPDPGVQASGSSHETTDKIDEADKTVHEVLNGDVPPEELEDLRAVRPGDAKIANYLFWLAYLDGNHDLMRQASRGARALHNAALAGHSDAEIRRLWYESNLDTMSDVLNTQRPGAGADEAERFDHLTGLYCQSLGMYRDQYGTTFEGVAYLELANTALCT
jgi:predicted small lipoprotein YifL